MPKLTSGSKKVNSNKRNGKRTASRSVGKPLASDRVGSKSDIGKQSDKPSHKPSRKQARERFAQLVQTITPQAVESLKSMTYASFLESKYWKIVRDYVVSKSDGCALCCSGDNLQVHHRRYAHRGEEYKHLKDLITLCKSCHHWYHTKPAGFE